MIRCILAGVGGQGTVLASKLIAQCAMNKGMAAHTAETIGMAQRGGSVVSHVAMGEGAHSPITPLGSAQVLIGFEPAEAVRALGYLQPGGTVVVSRKAVQPVTVSLGAGAYEGETMLDYLRRQPVRLIEVDADPICAQVGSAKVLNVSLLGAAAQSRALGISVEEVERAVRQMVPARFVEMNLTALRLGAAQA